MIILGIAETGMAQPVMKLREALREEPGSSLISLKLVDALESDRNFPLAQSVLSDLLQKFPQNPLLLLKRGNIHLMSGQILAAKEDFEKVLETETRLPDAMYGMIKIHEALNDWERSLSLCQTILSDDPGNAFAILHTAWACFRMKRFDEALKWYSHKDHFKRREMVLGRGWTLISLKDLTRARQAFEEITLLNPQDPEALDGIREVERLKLNDQLEAIPVAGEFNLKQAADILPKLRQQGRIIEAFQLSEALLASEPLNSTAISERALLFSMIGKWFEAEQCYSLLIRRETKPEYFRGRMSALFNLGRLSEAAIDAKEILKNAATDTLALKIIADDFYALGKFDKALECYEKLPEDLWLWQGKGWCNLVLGNKPVARKAFQDLLAHYPGNIVAIEGLRRTGE
ncbi:MAG: tetratricopeptide repeat protein [Candidatus Riflebacteria bacterium]|nr:tetratricopeptide repeat protein [Candidatus Riflebacteria bacterium]